MRNFFTNLLAGTLIFLVIATFFVVLYPKEALVATFLFMWIAMAKKLKRNSK